MLYLSIFMFSILLLIIPDEFGDRRVWGFMILTVLVCLILATVVIAPTEFASRQAQYYTLIQQQKYIETLPNVPVQGDGLIDLPNSKIAQQIIETKLKYWKDVEEYNATVLFWQSHPHWDILIWGLPRIGSDMKTLKLIIGVPYED